MNLRRVLAIARKNLRSLKHDRRTVGFLVFMPLLLITIFGYTFGGDVKNLDVEIVDFDASGTPSAPSAIITDLLDRDTMNVVRVTDPSEATEEAVQAAREKVEDADLWAVIVFERNFTADLNEAVLAIKTGGTVVPVAIMVYMDGTNPNIVSAVMGDLQISIQKVFASFEIVPPVRTAQVLVYGEDAEFIDFFAPGVMGMAAMMVTFMLSIISFVHERGQHTLDRLLASPATEGEIVAGYVLAFGLVGLVQSVVILITAILLFGIEVQGSVFLALFMIFIFGVGMQGMGFVLSAFAKNEFQAVQFMPIVLFPSILLSGVFWPLEAVPELLRPASYFLPLTYEVEGLRSVMIRGWGVWDVWAEVAVLLAFAAVMMLLSTYGLRKRR
jgi:ABC-2 type transport system permease protein